MRRLPLFTPECLNALTDLSKLSVDMGTNILARLEYKNAT